VGEREFTGERLTNERNQGDQTPWELIVNANVDAKL